MQFSIFHAFVCHTFAFAQPVYFFDIDLFFQFFIFYDVRPPPRSIGYLRCIMAGFLCMFALLLVQPLKGRPEDYFVAHGRTRYQLLRKWKVDDGALKFWHQQGWVPSLDMQDWKPGHAHGIMRCEKFWATPHPGMLSTEVEKMWRSCMLGVRRQPVSTLLWSHCREVALFPKPVPLISKDELLAGRS